MELVILDGYTLNPGDLSWKSLDPLAKVHVYDDTDKAETFSRVKNADAVFTNKVMFDATLLARLPKLKYIGILATGYNVVDIAAAHKHKITVTNVPAYSTDSVAQLAFAFILQFFFRTADHSAGVHAGKWTNASHFCYTESPVYELTNKTLGLIGFGNIGQKVALLGQAFGMKIQYANRSPKTAANLPEAKQVSVETVFKTSDVISLHCPLTNDTTHIINEKNLNYMKKTAYLINVSRGALVDEKALNSALQNKRIAGYAADVLSCEPPNTDNPLLGNDHCMLTPHIGWQAYEARQRLLNGAIANFRAFLDGKPQNIV